MRSPLDWAEHHRWGPIVYQQTEGERDSTSGLRGLRLMLAAVASTLVVSLPLVSDQQSVATIAALTLALLTAGVGVQALETPMLRPAFVRQRTASRLPVTPAWSVTQVPLTPARPRAPGRR